MDGVDDGDSGQWWLVWKAIRLVSSSRAPFLGCWAKPEPAYVALAHWPMFKKKKKNTKK